MKVPLTHLRRIEELEARVAGPARRPEDCLSFVELVTLPCLAPDARQRLLQAAQRRTPRQVDAIRRSDLCLVDEACPAGSPVTLEGIGALLHGALDDGDRRRRLAALLSARDITLQLAKQLHTLATANH